MVQTYPKIINYNHDIGDKIFFMQNNKVVEGEVAGLTAYVYKEKEKTIVKIEYSIAYKNESGVTCNSKFYSNAIFESKSKLLDSL